MTPLCEQDKPGSRGPWKLSQMQVEALCSETRHITAARPSQRAQPQRNGPSKWCITFVIQVSFQNRRYLHFQGKVQKPFILQAVTWIIHDLLLIIRQIFSISMKECGTDEIKKQIMTHVINEPQRSMELFKIIHPNLRAHK